MSISSAYSCGKIPILRAVLSAFSSWSMASISMSRLMVSYGAPFKHRDSKPTPPLPDICDCNLRVRVSGLYWNTITLGIGVKMSIPTIVPLIRRGEFGYVVMDIVFFFKI